MTVMNATGSEGTIPEPVTTPTPAGATAGDPTGVQTGITHTPEEVGGIVAKEVKPLKAKLREAEKAVAELAALKEAAKSDQEKAVEAARAEGAKDKATAIHGARVEGRMLSGMARHGIPEEMAPAFSAQLGEIEDLDAVGAAVDVLVKDSPGVWGVFAKPLAPATQGGAPVHVGTGEWDGVLTRSEIQEKINRAGGALSREDMGKLARARAEGRITG